MAATVHILCPVCRKVMGTKVDPEAISNTYDVGPQSCGKPTCHPPKG